MGKIRILMLGGTTEASALARALAGDQRYDALLSLAGRTEEPSLQPLPMRIGGFGGADGLAKYLRNGEFDLLIDATHPFASRISKSASEAAGSLGLPAFSLRRPQWTSQAGDRWTHVATIAEAITALGSRPRRVFLATGRQEAYRAEAAPQHFYLVRSVDPVEPRLVIAHAQYILDRGPFDIEGEIALLKAHRIDVVITKNSGGSATYAKIVAARQLGIEVVIVDRAPAPAMLTVETVEDALAAISHLYPPR